MMVVSSPLSIQSQLPQSHRCYRDTSASELVSQLAFNTQLPYNNAFETHHYSPYSLGISQPKTPQLSQGITDEQSGKILHDAQHAALHAEPGINVPEPDLGRSSPNLLKKPRLVDRGHTIGDKVLTSPNESIECQPFAPIEKSSPAKARSPDQQNPRDTDGAQPFPLVEWIREIRKDTFQAGLMLPMRWAKIIPKRQQAILDADETWLPPLAGRPFRSGSVPVDILQRLTNRADHQAATSGTTDGETAREEYPRETTQESLQRPQPSRQDGTSQSSPVDEADQDSDKETVDASQWSSSPQPPRLPPDSSPVTEPHQPKIKNKAQSGKGRLDTIDEADKVLQVDQAKDQQDEVHVPLQTHQAEERQDFTREEMQQSSKPEVIAHSATNRAHEVAPHAMSALDSSTGSPVQSQPGPQTVRTKLISKIQVKDTPCFPKEIQRAPQLITLPDDAPHSSFVGATYPDLPLAKPRKVFFRNEPDDTGSVASAREVDERKSCTPPRSLKRTIHTNNDEYETHNNARAPPDDENVVTASIIANATVAPEPPARSTTTAHEEASPRKRQKLGQSASEDRQSNVHVSDYQQHDNQRMLQRRRFLRSISTNWTNAGPEDPEAFLRHNHRAQLKTSSRASSPHVSARHSNVSRSEAIGTSATNLSVHKLYNSKQPARRLSSPRPSVNVNVENELFAFTFNTFKNAYPDYPGNQKSFRSALQLLLRLQSQPREPHPSLWDDFIFRMALDYKQYLAECIENDESAMEYQNYYYTRVKRSERTREIITEDVLQNLDGDVRLNRLDVRTSRLQQSRSVCSFHTPNEVEMSDAPTPISAPVCETQQTYERELPAVADRLQSSAEAKSKRQEKDQREIPETHIMRAESAASRSRQSLPSQLTRAQPTPEITKSAAKKRRSLPWDASESNTVAKSSRIPLQRMINTSNMQSSTSSKVEKWLLTSRAAGAASPELEAMELPTPEQDARTFAAVRNSDVPLLRLSTNAVATVEEIVQSIESPANTNARTPKVMHQPDTKFTSFARHYTKLQSEKAFQSLPVEKRRLPINIYDW